MCYFKHNANKIKRSWDVVHMWERQLPRISSGGALKDKYVADVEQSASGSTHCIVLLALRLPCSTSTYLRHDTRQMLG